jgi:hypothetical protein
MASKGNTDKVGETTDDTEKKDFKDSPIEGKKSPNPSEPPVTCETVIKRLRREGYQI